MEPREFGGVIETPTKLKPGPQSPAAAFSLGLVVSIVATWQSIGSRGYTTRVSVLVTIPQQQQLIDDLCRGLVLTR